jgi:hypothetical protein
MAILLQRKCGGPPPARAGPRLLAASPCAPWAKKPPNDRSRIHKRENLGCASQPHSSPSRSAHHWHSASGVPLSNSRTAPRPPSGDSTSSRRCPQSRPATPPPPHYLEREYLERIGSRHRNIILGKQRTGCAARRRWEIGKRCVLEQTCKLQIQSIGKRKGAKRKVCMGVDM